MHGTSVAPVQYACGQPGSLSAPCCTEHWTEEFACAQIVRVGNDHGIRFPRELGMLLKQLLYFDRYTRILAPQLSIMDDDRIRLS